MNVIALLCKCNWDFFLFHFISISNSVRWPGLIFLAFFFLLLDIFYIYIYQSYSNSNKMTLSTRNDDGTIFGNTIRIKMESYTYFWRYRRVRAHIDTEWADFKGEWKKCVTILSMKRMKRAKEAKKK